MLTFLQFYLLRETAWPGQPHYSELPHRPKKPSIDPKYKGPTEKLDYDELYRQYVYQGDDEAYRKLHESLMPHLIRLLYRRYYDEDRIQTEDVEDAVQQAFLRVVRGKQNRYDPKKGNLAGYIYTVAERELWKRVAHLNVRKRNTYGISKQKTAYTLPDSDLPEDPQKHIERIITSLPDTKTWTRAKRVLQLIAQGHKRREIAQKLDINKSTISHIIKRTIDYVNQDKAA